MEELLKRLKVRDVRAQRELRLRLFPMVMATCVRLMRDPVRAEETAEDIWMDFIYRHLDRVDEPRALGSYLRMMTVRRCVRLRELQLLHQEFSEQISPTDSPESHIIDKIDEERFQARLDACMQKLEERARSILRMRYHHGMTLEEIGKTEEVSKQYVGQIVKKSLQRLQRCVVVKP